MDISGKALLQALEAGVEMVKPNLQELESITGEASIEAAKKLYKKYSVAILLTLGAKGAAYISTESYFVKAGKITAINPVASGDSLLAAFVWARSRGWTIPEALKLGVAAGMENAKRGGGAQIKRAPVISIFNKLSCEQL